MFRITRHAPRVRFAAAMLLIVLPVLCLPGCSGKSALFSLLVPVTAHAPADTIEGWRAPIIAVMAPDSAAAGMPVKVKIGAMVTGCDIVNGIEIAVTGASIVLTPRIITGPGARDCPDWFRQVEAETVFTPPRAGAWTLVISGFSWPSGVAASVALPLVVGAPPAAMHRYDLLLQDPGSGLPLPGVRLAFTRVDGRYPPDTIGKAVTAADGHGVLLTPCVTGQDFTHYTVTALLADGSWRDFVWTAATCGAPERGILFLTPPRVLPPLPTRRTLLRAIR